MWGQYWCGVVGMVVYLHLLFVLHGVVKGFDGGFVYKIVFVGDVVGGRVYIALVMVATVSGVTIPGVCTGSGRSSVALTGGRFSGVGRTVSGSKGRFSFRCYSRRRSGGGNGASSFSVGGRVRNRARCSFRRLYVGGIGGDAKRRGMVVGSTSNSLTISGGCVCCGSCTCGRNSSCGSYCSNISCIQYSVGNGGERILCRTSCAPFNASIKSPPRFFMAGGCLCVSGCRVVRMSLSGGGSGIICSKGCEVFRNRI